MKNHKIDKTMMEVMSLGANKKSKCIVYAHNFKQAKKYLTDNNKIKLLNSFPFINAFAIESDRSQILSLSQQKFIKFVAPNSTAQAQMDVAKKVLNTESSTLTGNGITICYIDTGIAPHSDFTLKHNRIIKFLDLINNETKAYDDNGHGTFVAGCGSGSGALSAGKYAGVAPSSNIIAIKALDKDGQARAVKILEAMQWVFTNKNRYKIKVVCMSFGSEPLGTLDPIMRGADALVGAGIVVVAAAGNSGPQFETIKSPGISPKVITVGGIDDNRLHNEINNKFYEIAKFSSRGPALSRFKPDVVAPAVEITSCSNNKKELYRVLSGTSVATPMIAGMCALILEKSPNLSPLKVKQQIISLAKPITFNKNLEGYGLPVFY